MNSRNYLDTLAMLLVLIGYYGSFAALAARRPRGAVPLWTALVSGGVFGLLQDQVHPTPDNGYERMISYLNNEVPEDARIVVTTDTGWFLIEDRVDGQVDSIEELREKRVDRVILDSYLIAEGYGEASPEFYRFVTDQDELVYGFRGRSCGLLGVCRLPGDY